MSRLKVLIAESAEDFSAALADILQEDYQVRLCRDGIRAQEALQLFRPDILVLDMLLPGVDGISLLQQATALAQPPVILATAGYYSNYIVESAERMGVSYLMRKPCSAEGCAHRIKDLARLLVSSPAPKADPRTLVSNLLLQLGFSAKLKGYGFLREGILLFAQDTKQAVTKELYPAVAQLFGSTGERVERAIRCAIQSAWQSGPHAPWSSFFDNENAQLSCPTNGEFIARVADRLLLEKELDS